MSALAAVVGYAVMAAWALLAGALLVREIVDTVRAFVDQHEPGGMGEPHETVRPEASGETGAPSPNRRAPNGEGLMRYSSIEEITR